MVIVVKSEDEGHHKQQPSFKLKDGGKTISKNRLKAVPCAICHIPNGKHSVKELITCKSAIEILYGRLIQTVRIETEKINSKLSELKQETKDIKEKADGLSETVSTDSIQ